MSTTAANLSKRLNSSKYSLLILLTLAMFKNKMPCLFLTVSQSDYLIQILGINSHTEWQTMQTQIMKKPTDLDLHCFQKPGISGFSRTSVNILLV